MSTSRVDRILEILDVGLQDTTPQHYGFGPERVAPRQHLSEAHIQLLQEAMQRIEEQLRERIEEQLWAPTPLSQWLEERVNEHRSARLIDVTES